MSGYTDIKSKKLKKGLLRWLDNKKGVEISEGGKHQIKITCIHNGKSFPIPCNHSTINKFMVKGLMKFLVQNEICAKEEFDERLR